MRSPVTLAISLLLLAALGLSLPIIAGCDGGSGLPSGPTGSVAGKVTYNGSPVPAGSTRFRGIRHLGCR